MKKISIVICIIAFTILIAVNVLAEKGNLTLGIKVPEKVNVGDNVPIEITDSNGLPISGVSIYVNNSFVKITEGDGWANFRAEFIGNMTIEAMKMGYELTTVQVQVNPVSTNATNSQTEIVHAPGFDPIFSIVVLLSLIYVLKRK